jgi:tetratricopeptide (TPR) repeat protein
MRSQTLRYNRFSGQRKLIALAALATAAPLAGASAQRQAAPPPRLMVTTFAASEPGLGVQAAEAIRSRVTRDMDERKLQVITKKDIDLTLGASGYSTTESLASNDARALAVLLRADEYIEGTAVKTPAGVKVEAKLVLARDNTIQQPLPSAEGRNLDQAAQAISKNYQAARAQLEGEKSCANLFRDGKYKEAEQAARSALQKYPTGTIAAVCLGNAMNAQKQTDSVLAIAKRILTVDPRNVSALRWAADIYQERNDSEHATEMLIALLAANPSDEKLRDQVLNDLARNKRYDLAYPIVAEGLKNNPGDPKFLRLAWLIYLGGQKFDLAFQAGEELIRADTAAADTTYFIRTAAAYASQNNYAKAAEALKQGEAKFANNATLYINEAAAQQKAGNLPAALAAAQKAIQINPKVENGCVQVALIQGAMNQSDAMVSTIRGCASNGGDKHTFAQLILAEGNKAYKAGNASKNRADFQKAIQLLQLSDQLEASSDAKFLIGVSAFSIGQTAVSDAQAQKSCQLARQAKEMWAMAQENVPAGLQAYPDAAKQILTAIPQYTPATDEMVKRYCK